MTDMDEGARRALISEQIRERCSGCHYGEFDGLTKCRHHQHPGILGGYGTDWALTCEHYYAKPRFNGLDIAKNEMCRVVGNAGDAAGNAERAMREFESGEFLAAIETLRFVLDQARLTERAAKQARARLVAMLEAAK